MGCLRIISGDYSKMPFLVRSSVLGLVLEKGCYTGGISQTNQGALTLKKCI